MAADNSESKSNSTIFTLDHVTAGGRSLRQMQETLASLGLKTENGGPHSNHATEMALLSFPDGSYLELIGIQPDHDPQAVAAHYWTKFMQNEAGPCAWAVRVPDVGAEARRLSALGIEVSPTVRSGRLRTDGVRLDWETASVGAGSNGNFFPFMIRDISPREHRVFPGGQPTMSAYRGVSKVVLAVRDLPQAVQQYQRAYGLPDPVTAEDAEFGASLAWFQGTPVVLAAPSSGKSPLAGRLAQFGQSPCAFILAAADKGALPAPAARSRWFGGEISWFDSTALGWSLGVE